MGFELAGQDGHYKRVSGVVDRNGVILRAIGVDVPIAVRYAWSDVPVGSLTNAAGLPASPFRSDDWDGVTTGTTWRAWPRKRTASAEQPTQPQQQAPPPPPAPPQPSSPAP